MTKAEKRKQEQQRKRWTQEEKAFNADLNALLFKHKAKIEARSHGGAYCSSTVSLEVHIGENEFEIGVDNNDMDVTTVYWREPPETEE